MKRAFLCLILVSSLIVEPVYSESESAAAILPRSATESGPLQIGSAELLSKTRLGSPANGDSFAPANLDDDVVQSNTAVTPDFFSFGTEASNLEEGTNPENSSGARFSQVVVLPVGSGGLGRNVLYVSRNLATRQLGNGNSFNVRSTPDSRFLVFESLASNLVDDDTNLASDIFVAELNDSRRNVVSLDRVSVTQQGGQANGPSRNPDISDDGRFVAFVTDSTNLSPDDFNFTSDVVVKDRLTGTVARLGGSPGLLTTDGLAPNGATAIPLRGGEMTVFSTFATNLALEPDLQVSHKSAGAPVAQIYGSAVSARTSFIISTNLATREIGNGDSINVAFSENGRFGVFESLADNLVVNDNNNASDIFFFEIAEGRVVRLERVSTSAAGAEGNGHSRRPSVSNDGTLVAFETDATNLISIDQNGWTDVLVKRLSTGEVVRMTRTLDGEEPNGPSGEPVLYPDGRRVAFTSAATNFVTGDVNGLLDVFVVPITREADEPSVTQFVLPPPASPNPFCPSGFFTAVVDDGPIPGVSSGVFGLELLLDNPGTRRLEGGLNFGGLIDVSQVGFAGANITNPDNEPQVLNISLTGSPANDPSGSIPVRVKVSRQPAPNVLETVFETVTNLSLAQPFVDSVVVAPGYYVSTVAAEGAPASAAGGAAEGQFFFSLTTSFVDRPGGGFQGGAVVGGYHADNPSGGVSGFASFCISTPHSATVRTFGAPSYGPSGALDLRLRIQDADRVDLVTVPEGQ